MKRPDRITITTFWLDWLLLPIMLGAGWLTFRWALADFNLASSLGASATALPPWAVAVPLVLCAVGWVILGFGSLIRADRVATGVVRRLVHWHLDGRNAVHLEPGRDLVGHPADPVGLHWLHVVEAEVTKKRTAELSC